MCPSDFFISTYISIHRLREEPDINSPHSSNTSVISIHRLREEPDRCYSVTFFVCFYFNPQAP